MGREQAETWPGGAQGTGSGGERDPRAGAWCTQCGLEGAEEDESCCRLAGKVPVGLEGGVGGTAAPALPSSPSSSCPRGMLLTQGICLAFGGHETWGHLWLLPSTARLYFSLLCGRPHS